MSHLGAKDFGNRQEILKSQQDNIMKGIYGDDVIMKAEGSRGGKIIGHTRNGHPIYANKKAVHYSNFTPGDHEDASDLHLKEVKKYKNVDDQNDQRDLSEEHFHTSEEKREKELHKKTIGHTKSGAAIHAGKTLSEKEVEELHEKHPDIEDPYYKDKEHLGRGKLSKESQVYKIKAGDKHYLVHSDPSAQDTWHEIHED